MRGLSFLFARRYLFSRKSHSVINIVSIVSAISVSIPVMAMVILLSVFNGLESMVVSMYRIFDPDLIITASRGKIFDSQSALEKTVAIDGVFSASQILEESVLMEYDGSQTIGVLRGVDSCYSQVTKIDTTIVEGRYEPWFGDMPQAVIGRTLAYNLGVRYAIAKPLMIYTVGRGEYSPLFPVEAYNGKRIFPGGIFAIDAESDSKYVFTPIEFARSLLNRTDGATAIAVAVDKGQSDIDVKRRLEAALGEEFVVKTRFEQNEEFYRIMMYEKWGVYFIIMLVLIVASFLLVGSMTMLIIEKRADMRTLKALGANTAFVRGIFVKEGMLVYLCGAVMGLVLGVLICLAQQKWGFVTISAPTLLIDAYPVELRVQDIVGVCISFSVVSYLIASITTRLIIKKV